MKKITTLLLAVVAIMVTTNAAQAATMQQPTYNPDALTYGQNAEGAYYTSETQKLVHCWDMTCVVDENAYRKESSFWSVAMKIKLIIHPTYFHNVCYLQEKAGHVRYDYCDTL